MSEAAVKERIDGISQHLSHFGTAGGVHVPTDQKGFQRAKIRSDRSGALQEFGDRTVQHFKPKVTGEGGLCHGAIDQHIGVIVTGHFS